MIEAQLGLLKYLEELVESDKKYEKREYSKGSPARMLNLMDAGITLESDTISFILRLEPFHHIAQNICKYLSVLELAMVYKHSQDAPNWQAAVEKDLKRRTPQLNWSFCLIPKDDEVVTVQLSETFLNTPVASCITFFNTDFDRNIHYIMPNMNQGKTKTFQEFLKNDVNFGMDIPNLYISMDKIYFMDSRMYEIKNACFSTLYFPSIPGIEIRYESSVNRLVAKLNQLEQVDCLLIFAKNDNPDADIRNLMTYLSTRQSTNIPIAGSFGVSKKPGRNNLTYVTFTHMTDCVPKFSCASMVIHRNTHFETEVLKFKAQLIRRSEEILMNFVCYGRRRKYMELALLRQYFDCHMIQCYVNGEIGSTCFKREDNTEEDVPKKRARKNDSYTHGFSSVLFYIGWGDIREDSN